MNKLQHEIIIDHANDIATKEYGLIVDALGNVKSPGKFERTTIAGVYFYDFIFIENAAEEEEEFNDGSIICRFHASDAEVRAFNLPQSAMELEQTSDGFIYLAPWKIQASCKVMMKEERKFGA